MIGLLRFDVRQGGLGGNKGRVVEQRVCQGFDTRFLRHLAFGAAFEFEGQVNILHLLLGGGVVNRQRERGREFALLVNRFEDGFFALVQLAQVG